MHDREQPAWRYSTQWISEPDFNKRTVSGNSGNFGGGYATIYSNVGNAVNLKNTIVAGNGDELTVGNIENCNITANYSLVRLDPDDPSGNNQIRSGSNNIVGQDPQLGALQNNGGVLQTMLPATGSPAIDHGSAALALDGSGNQLLTDQRGA